MKTNWKTKKISEITQLFADGDWIEKKDQSDDGIRLIQTGNVGLGYLKDRAEKARYISEKTFKRLNCTEILPDDILISRLPDPVGRACIIPNTDEKMITAVDCTIIRFNEDILSKWFIYYSLSSEYQKQIDKEVGGATRQRISRKNLGDINVPVPPLPEQKRIVKTLDETFKKLEKAKEIAEKNLQNSKELFKSYLNNVFSNPGKDWEERPFKEVCEDLFAGGDVPKGNLSKTITEKYSVPIFANGIENQGLYGYTDIKKVTEPSITISARGTIGYSEIRTKPFFPIVRLIVAIPNSKIIDLRFLYYVAKNFKFTNTGSSIPQLTIPMVKDIMISFPKSLTEQQSIVKKLDKLSEQTKKLENLFIKKLSAIEELKKSILNKAFSKGL